MFKRFDSSYLFLIAANCVPIIGVLYFDWSLFSILIGYWVETAVIGIFTLIKMVYLAKISVSQQRMVMLIMQTFAVFSSCIGFMAAHLFFIMAIFSIVPGGDGWTGLSLFYNSTQEMFVMLITLFISHGYSFYHYFIKGGEAAQIEKSMGVSDVIGSKTAHRILKTLMLRIATTHVVLIVGIFILVLTKSTIVFSIVFILVKIVVDLKFHRKKHRPETVHI
jgi:hypothetical protein